MIDTDEDSISPNSGTHLRNELAVIVKPALIGLVMREIAFEKDHPGRTQIREQRAVALVQLHRGPQPDQKMIAHGTDICLSHCVRNATSYAWISAEAYVSRKT
jgi:hypothetical protein